MAHGPLPPGVINMGHLVAESPPALQGHFLHYRIFTRIFFKNMAGFTVIVADLL